MSLVVAVASAGTVAVAAAWQAVPVLRLHVPSIHIQLRRCAASRLDQALMDGRIQDHITGLVR